ncbi:FtsW/RodA/SpoVE family cell cycle protein [Sphingomonas donggukensis]|uniref:Probable peptidoglycan glycosyltransferase FtsW n=1 Tax=Sphingomonas donggukensis TaxID=2949093 RepID=A0ABY4TWX4_9SPHN|nr:FtsW/RodA/SpoVE family cell cycle protein [Sphingomonas donggukensis]URW76919.1 FtsW/RodA/SpoVE family cell cycle protein [Sphingomonas donggukensis]
MTGATRDDARGLRGRVEERLGRANRGPVAMWFWELDRVLLLLAFLLIAIGLIAVAAASPATARRYSDGSHQIAPMYYFWRQAMWVGLSIPVMLLVSMMPTSLARRFALGMAAFFLLALLATPIIGVEVNGAKRWLGMGIAQFQPSEFLKPVFIVSIAWMLSLRARDPDLPMVPVTLALTGLVGATLMLQPDFGQTIVFGSVWMILLMVSGVSSRIIGGFVGAGAAGVVAAYVFYDTARIRIDNFLFPDHGGAGADHYQTDMAHATITAGGVTGTGPGGGVAKFRLPEAHTDYIYSVVGEEFGLLACAIIAVLFLTIVVRVFVKLLDEEDAFRVLAAAGLAAQFGVQATINMAVNTGLAPSKGMTLPFISYGGSSMIALSIGMGLLLAFTRRNPYLHRSPYIVR